MRKWNETIADMTREALIEILELFVSSGGEGAITYLWWARPSSEGSLFTSFFFQINESFAHEAVATVTTVSRQNVSASSLLALSQLGAHKHNQPIILPRFRVQTQIFKYSSNTWTYARTAAHIKMLTKFNSLRQSNPVIFSNSLTWCREGIDCHHGEQVWPPHTYTCISVKYDGAFSLSKAEAAKAAGFLLTSFSLVFFFLICWQSRKLCAKCSRAELSETMHSIHWHMEMSVYQETDTYVQYVYTHRTSSKSHTCTQDELEKNRYSCQRKDWICILADSL